MNNNHPLDSHIFCMKCFLWTAVLGLACVGLLAACATTPGQAPLQLLPDIECAGQIELSASGPVGGMVKADCGQGFKLTHGGGS